MDPFFSTPNLDRLADEGVLFEKAFCSTPQCSPSRSTLMTGLYPSKTGVMGNVGASGGKPLQMKTLGAWLQEAGYHTAYFGKWHLGNDPTGNAGWDQADTKGSDSNTVKRALEFANQYDRDKPYALFLSFNNPHGIYHFERALGEPFQVDNISLSQSWRQETFEKKPPVQKQFMTEDQGTAIWGREQKDWEKYREYYREKVALYDSHVGEILNTFQEKNLLENTVVFATSDHGDMDTNHKLIFKGPFMYEHMVRIPFIVRLPKTLGGIPSKRIRDFHMVNTDVFPTILEFAGVRPPKTDGISLKPLLMGEKFSAKRDFVISEYYSKQRWVNPARMLRTDAFKLVRWIEHGDELYDLHNDPHELVNLADDKQYASVKQDLVAMLDRWIVENNDPFYSLSTVPLSAKPKKGKKDL